MRMRRKAWARPELDVCNFYVKDPAKNIGNWNNTFVKNQDIHLELGCGKGVFISEIAFKNRDINYIGIDLSNDVLGVARRNIVSKYNEENIDNVLLTSYNIERIDEILNNNDSIKRIYINFCNPWPKDRHKKRRLTHTRQLEKYMTFISNDAELYFKTDDDELFDESIEYFKQMNLDITYITYDLYSSDYTENITTEHEIMFTNQGIKIKFLIAKFNK